MSPVSRLLLVDKPGQYSTLLHQLCELCEFGCQEGFAVHVCLQRSSLVLLGTLHWYLAYLLSLLGTLIAIVAYATMDIEHAG